MHLIFCTKKQYNLLLTQLLLVIFNMEISPRKYFRDSFLKKNTIRYFKCNHLNLICTPKKQFRKNKIPLNFKYISFIKLWTFKFYFSITKTSFISSKINLSQRKTFYLRKAFRNGERGNEYVLSKGDICIFLKQMLQFSYHWASKFLCVMLRSLYGMFVFVVLNISHFGKENADFFSKLW